ncbi:MAG: tyrosine-type recombinase/integrase [Treponema sp.]|nr:tyrosine-type recombinase/integrase [Treponema sp.]
MSNLRYHVFRKPKKLKNGKSVRRWYYYWIDDSGKQIQKSCGKNIKNRNDAEDFIRSLPPPQKTPAAAPYDNRGILLYSKPANNANILVKDIAVEMFIPGTLHVKRRQQLNKSVNEDTLKANRVFMLHITAMWGDRTLRSLELDEVMNYLFAADRSGSWKNQYISALNEIYQEAQFLGCKIYKPNFPTIGKTPNKADILTDDELERLLIPQNFKHDFYLFYLCKLSGGLRMGEVRGLRVKQIIFDKKALIVDGFMKKRNVRTVYNKCGSPEHPKLRVIPYPDLTLDLLAAHIEKNNLNADDFVFTYNNKPVSKSMAETAFFTALINAGITWDKETLVKNGLWKRGHLHGTKDLIPDGRRIVPHSFRYTYVTKMRTTLIAEDVKKITGHESIAQVDYYNRLNLDRMLKAIPDADDAVRTLLPAAILQNSVTAVRV